MSLGSTENKPMILTAMKALAVAAPSGFMIQVASTILDPSVSTVESTVAGVVGGGAISVAVFYYFKGRMESKIEAHDLLIANQQRLHEALDTKMDKVAGDVAFLAGLAKRDTKNIRAQDA